MSIQRRLYESRIRGLDEAKTEFAVVATASGMLIKAFPKEEQARMYIKNKYSQRKNLRGNLGIVEVPKSRAPGNNMKKYGDIKVVKESVELDEGKFDYDPRIKKMSKKGKEILAHMTNSYETATHDDFIDHNNVHTLPKSVVQKTLTMASKERNLPAKQKKELALIKKELGESVELDEAESIHWNKMKKDERVSLLKDSGLPSSFAKDNWKGLDHRAKERMGKYVNKSTKGEYALRP